MRDLMRNGKANSLLRTGRIVFDLHRARTGRHCPRILHVFARNRFDFSNLSKSKRIKGWSLPSFLDGFERRRARDLYHFFDRITTSRER